jgi:hypothetical protein
VSAKIKKVFSCSPPPPDVTGKIPRVEARARFAVSPAEATVIAESAAGTKSGGLLSMAAASGSRADIPSGDALAEVAPVMARSMAGPARVPAVVVATAATKAVV